MLFVHPDPRSFSSSVAVFDFKYPDPSTHPTLTPPSRSIWMRSTQSIFVSSLLHPRTHNVAADRQKNDKKMKMTTKFGQQNSTDKYGKKLHRNCLQCALFHLFKQWRPYKMHKMTMTRERERKKNESTQLMNR